MVSFQTHGLFSQMSYISIGDPYRDKTNAIFRTVDKSKHVTPHRRRKKHGIVEEEKEEGFSRIFIGECLNTSKAFTRVADASKDKGRGWTPAGSMKKICGSGGLDPDRPISFLEVESEAVKAEPNPVERGVIFHEEKPWLSGVGGDPYPAHIPENEVAPVAKKKSKSGSSPIVHPKPFVSVCKLTSTFTSDYELRHYQPPLPRRQSKKKTEITTRTGPTVPSHPKKRKIKREMWLKRKKLPPDPYKDPVTLFRSQAKGVKPFYPQKGSMSLRTPSVLQTVISKRVNVENVKHIQSVY